MLGVSITLGCPLVLSHFTIPLRSIKATNHRFHRRNCVAPSGLPESTAPATFSRNAEPSPNCAHKSCKSFAGLDFRPAGSELRLIHQRVRSALGQVNPVQETSRRTFTVPMCDPICERRSIRGGFDWLAAHLQLGHRPLKRTGPSPSRAEPRLRGSVRPPTRAHPAAAHPQTACHSPSSRSVGPAPPHALSRWQSGSTAQSLA